MAKKKITELVEELALPIVAAEGLELVDVEFKKEGANWFLRVFIDKDGGVDIEDCSRVSEKLSDKLDEVDPIQESYFLEVSSPGAERPLKKPSDFLRAVGKTVHITMYEPIDGKKAVEGVLQSYTDTAVVVGEGEQAVTVPLNKIASARLALVF